ncbi:glycosyltransferase family 61 protein [Nocardioides alcanivorans]|uniref:glycosyltransferase family 61 protein n=1 Tax=Nocardioides alcanivorans TaxID=2897352 RepID=UPI001F1C8EBC|nr:glycosyltransferase family 61 protein [Nocardioides alcanivorans]
MPRLPAALEPAFPLVKRTHRFATRRVGGVTRAVAGVRTGARTVPTRGYETSRETAAAEPEHARLHPGMPSEVVSRPRPAGIPEGLPWWDGVLRADLPERYTLELSGGTVVGNYAAHLTSAGNLDFETSHYFDIHGWREHPIFLRPRLPEATHFPGTLVSLATRATGVNYYHFVMDLLTRWATLQECLPGVQVDAIYANTSTRFARELLELAGLGDVPVIEATKHASVRADRLLVPSLANAGLKAPPAHTDWLRTRLPARGRGAPWIYVTRGSRRNSRRVANEAEVLSVLEPLGFEVFDPGAHPVQRQIDVFAGASVIVAPHGAALTNLNFCSPGCGCSSSSRRATSTKGCGRSSPTSPMHAIATSSVRRTGRPGAGAGAGSHGSGRTPRR